MAAFLAATVGTFSQVPSRKALEEENLGDAAAAEYGVPKTAKESVTRQNFNLHGAMLPQVGTLVPEPSSLDKASMWSVGCETLDRGFADFSKYKQFFRPLGIGYARVQSGWEKTEKAKGEYDFAWLDTIVDGLREQGVKPWLSLSYGNKLYGSTRSKIESMCSKENMEAWNTYVQAIVKHYEGRVDHWEVWNEPNLKDKDVRWFSELLMNTVRSVRKAAPKAKIIAFGTARVDYDYICNVFDYINAKDRKIVGHLQISV